MLGFAILSFFFTKHIGGLANGNLASTTSSKEIDVASQLNDQHQLQLNKQITFHPSLTVGLFFSFILLVLLII